MLICWRLFAVEQCVVTTAAQDKGTDLFSKKIDLSLFSHPRSCRQPFVTDCYRPRLCKNVFERVRYSKPDWKSRFDAKFTSADVPINFRFNADARTSILAKRFYTLWARSGSLL